MEELSKSEKKKQRKEKRKRRKESRKTDFHYSFFTIVLIFCLMQIGYGAILNIGKIISYQGKMFTLENLLKKAQARNEDLKMEKKIISDKIFDSCSSSFDNRVNHKLNFPSRS